MEQSKRLILKDYLWVVAFNLTTIVVGLGISLILPLKLSVLEYAVWKEYLLVFVVAGFLNLGLADGLYLLWGGRKLKELKESLLSYVLIVFTISIIVCPLYLIIVNQIFDNFLFFTLLAINSVAYNVFGFLVNIFNTTGNYTYANVANLCNRSLFFLAIVITGVSDSALLVILSTSSYVLVALVTTFLLWLKGFRLHIGETSAIVRNSVRAIKKGLPLLITNLLQLVVFNLDLAIIRIIGTQEEFAYYGFTVTVLKAVLILATSGKTVLFPVLKRDSGRIYSSNGNMEFALVALVLIGSILSYFALPILVERFIPKYNDSVDFMLILLSALPFLFVVMSLQSTQLMSENRQVSLLKNTVATIIIGLALNLPGILFRNIYLIAYASVVTYLVYYLINRISIGIGMGKGEIFLSLLVSSLILSMKFLPDSFLIPTLISVVVLLAIYIVKVLI